MPYAIKCRTAGSSGHLKPDIIKYVLRKPTGFGFRSTLFLYEKLLCKESVRHLASDTVHRLLGSSGLRILQIIFINLIKQLPGADAQLIGGG